MCEAPDIVERLKRRFVLLVQQLHQPVGMDEHGVGLRLRQTEQLAHFIREGDVKYRSVQQTVCDLIVKDMNFADSGDFFDQSFDFARIFY